MARDLPARRRTTTTTVETVGEEGNPLRARIRKRLDGHMAMNPEAYCLAYWNAVSDTPNAKLLIMKKVGGYLSKVGEIGPGEIDSKDVETWIMEEWKDGAYQLQPEVAGKMYGPASKVYRFGNTGEERAPRVEQESIDAEISTAMKRLGHVAALSKLREVVTADDDKGKKGDGDMDMAGVAALIQAQQAPLLEMMRQTEQRAQRAEERVEKLLEKMMDSRATQTQAQVPLFAEILKGAVSKPEVLSVLLNGAPAPESNWLDTLRDVAREFAPMLQTLLAQAMNRSAGALPLPPGGATDKMSVPTQPGDPSPTGTQGDGPMPMPLNEEQEMAKNMLVDFVAKGDFPNAYAVLESFPGFVPVGGTAMPLGEFIISKIDPAASPKVYLPQLGTLIPDLRKTLPQAEAFVKFIQDRIVADDEADKRARSARDQAPTRGGADDE